MADFNAMRRNHICFFHPLKLRLFIFFLCVCNMIYIIHNICVVHILCAVHCETIRTIDRHKFGVHRASIGSVKRLTLIRQKDSHEPTAWERNPREYSRTRHMHVTRMKIHRKIKHTRTPHIAHAHIRHKHSAREFSRRKTEDEKYVHIRLKQDLRVMEVLQNRIWPAVGPVAVAAHSRHIIEMARWKR